MKPFTAASRGGLLAPLALCSAAAFAQSNTAAAPAEAASAPEAVLPVVRVDGSRPGEMPSEKTGTYGVRSANTATKLDLSQRETPQSISVVTRTQIEDQGLRNANDLLSSVTGVNVERVEPGRSYFSVRGFEVSNFQLDGIGLPFATGDQLGDIDTAIYDRVEVLRGANGLMSSTGNPSATVNFVRKRPTGPFQAQAALTLGSWNQRRLEGDVSGALNESGSVRGRFVAAAEKSDSYLDRYSLKKHVFSGIVEADLASDTLLTVGHSQQHNKPRGVMWGALPMFDSTGAATNYDVSASTAPDWTYWTTDDRQTFAELAQQLGGGWQAKFSLTRRELGSNAELFYVYGTPNDTTGGLFGYPSKYGHVEKQWIADAHVTGPFTLGGRRHELVLGVNWARSDSALHSSDDEVGLVELSEDEVLAGSYPRPAFDEGITGSADFHDRRKSFYGAARFNLADDFKLFTGANVTRVTSTGLQYGVDHDYGITKTTPFVGAVWDFAADYSAYASATRIFNPQHQLDLNGGVIDPIEGSNVEAGVKGEWFDKQLNGSLAVFRTKQDNTAEYADFQNGHSLYRGVNATSTGFELDLAGRIGRDWDVSAGYTQMRIEGDDGEAVRTYVPRKTLRLSTAYRVAALPGLKLGASVKAQSDFYRVQSRDATTGDPTIVTRQGGVAVLDLMARYEIDAHWSLTANLYNVTDRKLLTSLLWAQSYYAAPRSGSVTLSWKY
ncbi:TonB-dependent siderophore receptor [Caldimonas sp. KR1-144]|uniref:TonB-dependent siderophore receptor n=1 Tax=Caldimonas sp. KR1-144 TaxID=3400911 RepID=UPI003C113258